MFENISDKNGILANNKDNIIKGYDIDISGTLIMLLNIKIVLTIPIL